MVSEKKSLFKRILIIIIAVFILFSAASMVATKIVYDNIFERYDTAAVVPSGLAFTVQGREELEFSSGENSLCGYLYRSAQAESHSCLVVLATGFNAGADDYLWQIKSLLDFGYSVFTFDATGCCKSGGESAVGFSQILLDTRDALKYVEKNNRFGYNELVLMGHSRGGYAACCLLGDEFDISAVVSVSGVNSAMEGVICSSAQYVGPLAYGNWGGLWAYQAMLFGGETVSLCADREISESDVPVLIIHGKNDTQVPTDRYSIISHRGEITSKNAEYIICDTPEMDGHTSLLFSPDGTANDELMSQIDDFLTRKIK